MEQPQAVSPPSGDKTEYEAELVDEMGAQSGSVAAVPPDSETEVEAGEATPQADDRPLTEASLDEEAAPQASQASDESVAEMGPEQEAALSGDEPPPEASLDQEARPIEAQSEELKEEEPEIDDGREWYVVHSYSGYENKVKQNLEQRIESMNMHDRIFRVVVPTEEEIEIREGHRRKTKKRVFPGYILVQMVMDEESWYVVRNTPGVTGFVGTGNKPSPLMPQEAQKILERMEMEAPKIKVSFREGQTVRIVDGPFTDFVGTVEELNLEKGKVRVLVSFFGRETPVELDFLQVQKQ
jgi:transcriptional antiterminator NusG